jgi:hypothetical protein
MVHVTFYAQPRTNRPFLRVSRLKQGEMEEATDPEVQNYLIFTDIGGSAYKVLFAMDEKMSVQIKNVQNPKKNWSLVFSSAYFNVTLTLMEYTKTVKMEGEEPPGPDERMMSIECDGDYYYIVHFIQSFYSDFTKKRPNELSNWAAFTKLTAISPQAHLQHWEEYLKVNLADEANSRLQYMQSQVTTAKNRGINTMEAEQLIRKMATAIKHSNFPQAMDIARMIEPVLEGVTTEHQEMSELSTDANDAILFTQEIIMVAKKEGVDVSEAKGMFHLVKQALDDKDYQKVIDLANRVKSIVESNKVKHNNAIERYNSTKAKLKKAQSKGVEIGDSTKKMKLAKRAFDDREYDIVMEYCDQALEMMTEALRKKKKELSKKEEANQAIERAKEALEAAKEKDLDIGRQEKLLEQAENQLRKGEEEKAIENAEMIQTQLKELSTVASSLKETLRDLRSKVEELANFMDMAKALAVLAAAESAYEESDYEKSQSQVAGIKDQIERTKTVARPRISIGFSNKQFQSGVWNRCKLTVTNSGKAHAKNIELVFSGTIEVMRIRKLPILKASERKTVEIGLRSDDVGELPLDMEITYYRHYDDAKYQAQGVKWVKFGQKPVITGEDEEIPSYPSQAEDEGKAPSETPPPSPAGGEEYIEKLTTSIQESYTYLVKGESFEPAFQAFERLIKGGSKGMCITRNFPKRLHDKYDLGNSKVIWLTNVQGDKMIRPSDIEKIRHSISLFLKENEGAVLLLDGIEYLITHNKYESVLKFVQSLKDQVAIKKAKFLIPISPSAIEGHELKLIEREVDEIIQLEG